MNLPMRPEVTSQQVNKKFLDFFHQAPFSLSASAVAFCWIALAYLGLLAIPIPLHYLFSAVVIIEIGFFFVFRIRLKALKPFSQPTGHSEQNQSFGRLRVFASMLSTLSLTNMGDAADTGFFFRQWFLDSAPVDPNTKHPMIPRGNMIQWVAWALFGRFPNQLNTDEVHECLQLVELFERTTRISFAPGFDPRLKPMRLSLEPITGAWHRPLTYYYLVSCIQAGAKLFLRHFLSFRRYQLAQHHYWYRPSNDSSSDDKSSSSFGPSSRKKFPIVFIHGIGHGLIYYLHFLNQIVDRDIFLIELPFIATRFTEGPSPSDQIMSMIDVMLQEHNFSKAVFIGHSYGTFVISWCLKFTPHIIHSVFLIDPVCLLLSFPTTCYTFVYAKPEEPIDWVRHLFVSSELNIVGVMRRAFYWMDMQLFVQDLPRIAAIQQWQQDEAARTGFYCEYEAAWFPPHVPQSKRQPGDVCPCILGQMKAQRYNPAYLSTVSVHKRPYIVHRQLDEFEQQSQQQPYSNNFASDIMNNNSDDQYFPSRLHNDSSGPSTTSASSTASTTDQTFEIAQVPFKVTGSNPPPTKHHSIRHTDLFHDQQHYGLHAHTPQRTALRQRSVAALQAAADAGQEEPPASRPYSHLPSSFQYDDAKAAYAKKILGFVPEQCEIDVFGIFDLIGCPDPTYSNYIQTQRVMPSQRSVLDEDLPPPPRVTKTTSHAAATTNNNNNTVATPSTTTQHGSDDQFTPELVRQSIEDCHVKNLTRWTRRPTDNSLDMTIRDPDTHDVVNIPNISGSIVLDPTPHSAEYRQYAATKSTLDDLDVTPMPSSCVVSSSTAGDKSARVTTVDHVVSAGGASSPTSSTTALRHIAECGGLNDADDSATAAAAATSGDAVVHRNSISTNTNDNDDDIYRLSHRQSSQLRISATLSNGLIANSSSVTQRLLQAQHHAAQQHVAGIKSASGTGLFSMRQTLPCGCLGSCRCGASPGYAHDPSVHFSQSTDALGALGYDHTSLQLTQYKVDENNGNLTVISHGKPEIPHQIQNSQQRLLRQELHVADVIVTDDDDEDTRRRDASAFINFTHENNLIDNLPSNAMACPSTSDDGVSVTATAATAAVAKTTPSSIESTTGGDQYSEMSDHPVQIKVALLLGGKDDLVPSDRIVRNWRLWSEHLFGEDIEVFKRRERIKAQVARERRLLAAAAAAADPSRGDTADTFQYTYNTFRQAQRDVAYGKTHGNSQLIEQAHASVYQAPVQLETSDVNLNNVYAAVPRFEARMDGDLLTSMEHSFAYRNHHGPSIHESVPVVAPGKTAVSYTSDDLLERAEQIRAGHLAPASARAATRAAPAAAAAAASSPSNELLRPDIDVPSHMKHIVRTRILYNPVGSHAGFIVTAKPDVLTLFDWLCDEE